jgi:hypothetical protein
MDTFKNIPLIRGNEGPESLPRSDNGFMEKWTQLKERKKQLKKNLLKGGSMSLSKRRSKSSRRSKSRRSK